MSRGEIPGFLFLSSQFSEKANLSDAFVNIRLRI